MLKQFFSLGGDLDRRRFLFAFTIIYVTTIAGGLGLLALLYGLTFSASRLGMDDGLIDGLSIPLVLLAVLAIVIPNLWSTAATVMKRLRNIGLPPAPVIAAVILIVAADHLLLSRYLPDHFIWPFQRATPVTGVVEMALYAVLLLWPGRTPPAFYSEADLAQPMIEYGARPRPAFGLKA